LAYVAWFPETIPRIVGPGSDFASQFPAWIAGFTLSLARLHFCSAPDGCRRVGQIRADGFDRKSVASLRFQRPVLRFCRVPGSAYAVGFFDDESFESDEAETKRASPWSESSTRTNSASRPAIHFRHPGSSRWHKTDAEQVSVRTSERAVPPSSARVDRIESSCFRELNLVVVEADEEVDSQFLGIVRVG